MNGKHTIIYCLLVALPLMLPVATGCNKEKNERVPPVYVNFTVDVTSGQYSDLQLIGGWVYVTGGYRGIVLYRNSMDEIVALDRTSTYKPESQGNQVIVEQGSPIAADTISGMRYFLMDGSVIEGPVNVPLKRYGTNFNGIVLHVYN
jgi:hypothetical protein